VNAKIVKKKQSRKYFQRIRGKTEKQSAESSLKPRADASASALVSL
jgi:hypothetical protein